MPAVLYVMPQQVNIVFRIVRKLTFLPMVVMAGWMEAATDRTGTLKLTMPV